MIPTVQPSIVMPLDREGVIQYICRDDNPRQPLFTRDDVLRYVHNDEGHQPLVIVEAMDRSDPHSLHVALQTVPPLKDILEVETSGPAVVVHLRRSTGAINAVVVTGKHQLAGPGPSYRHDPKLGPDETFGAIRQVIEDQEYRIRRELRQKGRTA